MSESGGLFRSDKPPWLTQPEKVARQSVASAVPQYLYIQMEHCDGKTLRDEIMNDLHKDMVCMRGG